MDLSKEVQELIDHWNEARSDGEWTGEEIHTAVREGFDVFHTMLDLDDSKESRDALADQLQILITRLAAEQLDGRPFIRVIALTFIDEAADRIIEAIAEYTGTAEDFWQGEVVPILVRWRDTLGRIIGG